MSDGEHDCPVCGRSFDTAQGVRIHRGMAHDRPTIECDHCGDEFEAPPSQVDARRFCSDDCRDAVFGRPTVTCEVCGDDFDVAPSREDTARFCSLECKYEGHSDDQQGDGNGNWQGGLVEITCEWCGDPFEVKPAEADTRQHCSKGCMSARLSEEQVGEAHPNYSRVETTCVHCGETIHVREHRMELHDRQFCSRSCWRSHRSDRYSGNANPNWGGGKSIYDAVKKLLPGTPWRINRRTARERANHRCQMCGGTPTGNKAVLDVHHIVPVMCGGTNELWNTLSLCESCHSTAESFTRNHLDRCLVDWLDGELPEGRLPSREYMAQLDDDPTGQTELTEFADG